MVATCVGGPGGARMAAGAADGHRLDQQRKNRERAGREYRPVVEDLAEGELVAMPVRSGGSFDPLGIRGADVQRADDLVAVVDGHPGRWLLITLTVDRAKFIGPEAAYQRCNDRVREVARVASSSGIHATALELQGKTGAGWPHWHLICWAPDGRSIESIRDVVRRAWRTLTEFIDEGTGEVTVSREAIGFVDVTEAREREGVGRYTAKYLLKAWPAVPAWMGESSRQLRKLRLSSKAFDWLEREGRHVRHRGGRRKPDGNRRPARRLFDRMAWSGASMALMRRESGRLRFVRILPVTSDMRGAEWMRKHGAEPIRLGPWASMRWKCPDNVGRAVRREWSELREYQHQYVDERREMLSTEWEREQSRRAEREHFSAGEGRGADRQGDGLVVGAPGQVEDGERVPAPGQADGRRVHRARVGSPGDGGAGSADGCGAVLVVEFDDGAA